MTLFGIIPGWILTPGYQAEHTVLWWTLLWCEAAMQLLHLALLELVLKQVGQLYRWGSAADVLVSLLPAGYAKSQYFLRMGSCCFKGCKHNGELLVGFQTFLSSLKFHFLFTFSSLSLACHEDAMATMFPPTWEGTEVWVGMHNYGTRQPQCKLWCLKQLVLDETYLSSTWTDSLGEKKQAMH